LNNGHYKQTTTSDHAPLAKSRLQNRFSVVLTRVRTAPTQSQVSPDT